MSATLVLPKCLGELAPVCHAIDKNGWPINGINFRVGETGMTKATATDGRIALRVDLDDATDIGGAIEITVDPKLLKAALGACSTAAMPATGRLTEKGLDVSGRGATAHVPALPGTFPNLDDVIPQGGKSTAGIEILMSGVLLPRVCTALYRACGGRPKADDESSALVFSMDGPKRPVRIDYKHGDRLGVAVIMPLAPAKGGAK